MLSESRRERLRSIVSQLLGVCKRGRPDVDIAVAYLCTMVSKSTTDDWKRLRRLLHFLQTTKDDEIIISVQSLKELYPWTDASCAVHPNMRSHTGGTMSLSRGVIMMVLFSSSAFHEPSRDNAFLATKILVTPTGLIKS